VWNRPPLWAETCRWPTCSIPWAWWNLWRWRAGDVGGRPAASRTWSTASSAPLFNPPRPRAGAADTSPRRRGPPPPTPPWRPPPRPPALGGLPAPTLRLPDSVQLAEDLDACLERPRGWLARHAGILQRHIWAVHEPLAVAAECGLACLGSAGVLPEEVDALLV